MVGQDDFIRAATEHGAPLRLADKFFFLAKMMASDFNHWATENYMIPQNELISAYLNQTK